MVIKNIGDKIINIGTTVLMPDKEMRASKELAATPAIQTFARMGFIKVEDGEEEKAAARKAAAAKKKSEEEAAAKKKAEEETAKKAAAAAAKTTVQDK